ncbi:hypothetical protein [Winogradskyella bathintestinalis]|uniref:Organic solvent tolerance-like N-terminal domain-containing protein n=1 Tax=Winogradskyella bathintestinalis TaxID=3035208 RepID=A0ABT7ZS64_9FLAO|nr:hypothetical protein [Winogradskyella bathintestinalis]MDN3491854.1 hypothetical protein [Winogradskyella bathintestinalis]
MKYYILLLFLAFSLISLAQKVEKDGKTYIIKKEKIFLEGKEVTDSLSEEEKTLIFKEGVLIRESLNLKAIELERKEKERKGKEEAAAKLEKESKKAQKAQKKLKRSSKRLKRN